MQVTWVAPGPDLGGQAGEPRVHTRQSKAKPGQSQASRGPLQPDPGSQRRLGGWGQGWVVQHQGPVLQHRPCRESTESHRIRAGRDSVSPLLVL